MPVTVNSSTPDGKRYRIKMDKKDPDTGSVELTTWQPGETPPASPGSKQKYDIDSVKAAVDGSKLLCKTHIFFLSFKITVTLKAGNQPSIAIKIDSAAATNYPVSTADYNKLKQYIADCHFPAL